MKNATEHFYETIKPYCKVIEKERLKLQSIENEPFTDILQHLEKVSEAQWRLQSHEAMLRAVMRYLGDDEVYYNNEPIIMEEGFIVSAEDYFTV